MKYTSAQANKLLKKLNDEYSALLDKEQRSRDFRAAMGEDIESVRPAYDYAKTQARLEELEGAIRRLKHAINRFNTTQVVDGFGITIDEMLVYIPQLTKRKSKLLEMKSRLPKERVEEQYGRQSNILYCKGLIFGRTLHMKIEGSCVTFEPCDAAFVKKFGPLEAANMVLDYHSVHPNMPFLYDAEQLAGFFGISCGELNHIVNHIQKEYKKAFLPKKDGTYRSLYIPSIRLQFCLGPIKDRILSQLPVSKFATAYQKGSSTRKNAEPHIGKKNLLKLDITDFFGSISFEQVLCAAFNTRYVTKQVGFLLTSLCCKNDALPQGSPTSPALSNIVMRRFDDQIGRWCNQRQITYTRYCDDMTFSSDRPLYGVYQKVKKMLFEMGFELNEAKTHFISNADRQTVTGLVVNEKLSIPGSYKRNLRQEIYYTLKFGIEDSIVYGNRLNFLEDGQPIRCPTYMTHLIGSVQYVLQIEPENRWFLNAKQKLLDYARAYFRAEGLGEEYYLHRSRLHEKDE